MASPTSSNSSTGYFNRAWEFVASATSSAKDAIVNRLEDFVDDDLDTESSNLTSTITSSIGQAVGAGYSAAKYIPGVSWAEEKVLQSVTGLAKYILLNPDFDPAKVITETKAEIGRLIPDKDPSVLSLIDYLAETLGKKLPAVVNQDNWGVDFLTAVGLMTYRNLIVDMQKQDPNITTTSQVVNAIIFDLAETAQSKLDLKCLQEAFKETHPEARQENMNKVIEPLVVKLLDRLFLCEILREIEGESKTIDIVNNLGFNFSFYDYIKDYCQSILVDFCANVDDKQTGDPAELIEQYPEGDKAIALLEDVEASLIDGVKESFQDSEKREKLGAVIVDKMDGVKNKAELVVLVEQVLAAVGEDAKSEKPKLTGGWNLASHIVRPVILNGFLAAAQKSSNPVDRNVFGPQEEENTSIVYHIISELYNQSSEFILNDQLSLDQKCETIVDMIFAFTNLETPDQLKVPIFNNEILELGRTTLLELVKEETSVLINLEKEKADYKAQLTALRANPDVESELEVVGKYLTGKILTSVKGTKLFSRHLRLGTDNKAKLWETTIENVVECIVLQVLISRYNENPTLAPANLLNDLIEIARKALTDPGVQVQLDAVNAAANQEFAAVNAMEEGREKEKALQAAKRRKEKSLNKIFLGTATTLIQTILPEDQISIPLAPTSKNFLMGMGAEILSDLFVDLYANSSPWFLDKEETRERLGTAGLFSNEETNVPEQAIKAFSKQIQAEILAYQPQIAGSIVQDAQKQTGMPDEEPQAHPFVLSNLEAVQKDVLEEVIDAIGYRAAENFAITVVAREQNEADRSDFITKLTTKATARIADYMENVATISETSKMAPHEIDDQAYLVKSDEKLIHPAENSLDENGNLIRVRMSQLRDKKRELLHKLDKLKDQKDTSLYRETLGQYEDVKNERITLKKKIEIHRKEKFFDPAAKKMLAGIGIVDETKMPGLTETQASEYQYAVDFLSEKLKTLMDRFANGNLMNELILSSIQDMRNPPQTNLNPAISANSESTPVVAVEDDEI